MLNLNEEQARRLETCRQAASRYFAAFPDLRSLEEAQRLLHIETGICAESAREGLSPSKAAGRTPQNR